MSADDPLAPRSKEGVVLADDRVELVLKVLLAHANKSQIKKLLAHKFGLAPRTCEPIITEAKRGLAADAAVNPDVYRADSLLRYTSIQDELQAAAEAIAARPSTEKDRYWQTLQRVQLAKGRIQVQERIDKLLGLEAPEQHEHPGAVVQFSLSDGRLRDFHALRHTFISGL